MNVGVAVHSIVASAPADPITGGVVSVTVIVCVLVALVLPQASIASQLLVLVKLFAQLPAVVTSLNNLTVGDPHASLAVGAVNDGVAVHSIVASAPADPITGGVVSVTVIVCVLVALVLPQASIASQLLVLVKLFAQLPAVVTSLNNLTVELPHASLAVGAVNDGVAVHSIVASAPADPIVGGVVSVTVIVCVLVALVLPQASIASQLLVLV